MLCELALNFCVNRGFIWSMGKKEYVKLTTKEGFVLTAPQMCMCDNNTTRENRRGTKIVRNTAVLCPQSEGRVATGSIRPASQMKLITVSL